MPAAGAAAAADDTVTDQDLEEVRAYMAGAPRLLAMPAFAGIAQPSPSAEMHD
jgi:hypothetical protein